MSVTIAVNEVIKINVIRYNYSYCSKKVIKNYRLQPTPAIFDNKTLRGK